MEGFRQINHHPKEGVPNRLDSEKQMLGLARAFKIRLDGTQQSFAVHESLATE